MKQIRTVEDVLKVTIELNTEEDIDNYTESQINESFNTYISDVENTLQCALMDVSLKQGSFSMKDIELNKNTPKITNEINV